MGSIDAGSGAYTLELGVPPPLPPSLPAWVTPPPPSWLMFFPIPFDSCEITLLWGVLGSCLPQSLQNPTGKGSSLGGRVGPWAPPTWTPILFHLSQVATAQASASASVKWGNNTHLVSP